MGQGRRRPVHFPGAAAALPGAGPVLMLPLHRLGDLGLEQFSVSELFSSILVPGFFLLACILQLHYFHRPFMQLTDMEHVSLPGTRLPRWAHRCGPALPVRPWRGHIFHLQIPRGICSYQGDGSSVEVAGTVGMSCDTAVHLNWQLQQNRCQQGFFQPQEMRGAGTQLGDDIFGPSPRQDAVSGTPLLQEEQEEQQQQQQQQQEEEEDSRNEGLGVATPHQATQVPEGGLGG